MTDDEVTAQGMTDDEVEKASAPPPIAEVAAPEAKPQSFGDSLSSHLKSLVQPFKDIGNSALAANDFATRAIFHPVDTFGGGKALPAAREVLRGVNSNIPFANDLVEQLPAGPPAVSPEDAAAAPGAQAFGGFAGTPVAGAVGGIAAKGIETVAPLLGSAIGSAGAKERQIVRASEDLAEGANKRARANIKADVVDTAVRENPALRAAAGNDVKVTKVIEKAKADAGAQLREIYSSAPSEVSPSNAVANMDAKIGELSKGTSREREVARALKSVRDEFQEAHGAKTAITPQEMRAEQSAYQAKGYGKAMPGDEAATARIAANQEASKAVGDAVVRHVTGMNYAEAKAAAKSDPAGIAGRLFKANDTINAANKIEAAIADRAAKVQPHAGIVGTAQKIGHVINHPGSLVPAAADKGVRLVDAGIARFGPGPDGTLARFVKAAQQGNPFAQRQLRILSATPAGASRLAAIQAQLSQQGAP